MKTPTRKMLFNLAAGVAIACTAALVLIPSVASAAPASAAASVNVRSGPGTSYAVVDQLHAGEAVDVKGCRAGWCYITHSGPDGYVSASYLTREGRRMEPNFNLSFDFGSGSISIGNGGISIGIGDQPDRSRPPMHRAAVCFYEDINYRGRSFCVDPRRSVRSLDGYWNDRISSIRNPAGLRVTVCTDWNFGGDCRTYSSSARYVGSFNDLISSIRVR